MNSSREIEDWEAPMSEIRDWTYTLIGVFGFENVEVLRERTLKTALNERDVMLLACLDEVLKNHSAIVDRVMVRGNNIPIISSHAPPIHPFDAHRSLLAILNNKRYVPREVPDDTPALHTSEYIRWFLLTLLGKFRYDDKKAWEEREVFWRRIQLQHDPHTKPDDWEDFMRSRRDEETQNHRASRDRQTNTIYDNMASVSPSGLTTTTLNLSPHPYHWHEAFQIASPMLQPPFTILDTGYPVVFAPPR